MTDTNNKALWPYVGLNQDQQNTSDLAISELNFKYYLFSLLKNLKSISRTSKGIITTKSASEKDKIFCDLKRTPESTSKIVEKNFISLIYSLYNHKDVTFNSASELKTFFRKLYLIINENIVKTEFFLRVGKEKHNRIAKTEDVEALYDQFCIDCFARLESISMENYKEFSGWVFYKICRDHYFADGCGKMSLAISSWVLMRGKIELPDFSLKPKISVNSEILDYIYESQNPNSEYMRHYNLWLSQYYSLWTI